MNKQNVIAIISLIVSIFAITVVFLSKEVILEVYKGFTQAQTSSSQGFADRWTRTDHNEYAAGVQKQINRLHQQIEQLKKTD